MDVFEIDHPHNEASGLLHLSSRAVETRYGWTEAFWIVSDEAPADEAVGALGRTEEGRWEVKRLRAKTGKRSTSRETDDAEALARAGGWIYLFGSQFGAKSGPLEPSRHWVARFNEGLVRAKKGKLKGRMKVVRPAFLIHRLVNDALQSAEVELLPRGNAAREDQLRPALEEAIAKDERWRDRLGLHDHPVNVEGATFLPHGRLLLGLRYPVTADGHPILVEIDGIDRLFAKKKRRKKVGDPEVTRVVVLENVGSADRPAGIRDLAQQGTTVHAITGDLDSEPDESRILADHPEGKQADSAHVVFELPRNREIRLRAELVRRFDDGANVEGITVSDDGTVWYVHDAEQIRLARASPDEPRVDAS